MAKSYLRSAVLTTQGRRQLTFSSGCVAGLRSAQRHFFKVFVI